MDPIRGFLFLDFESASAANLDNTGSEAYAAHDSTMLHCAAFGYATDSSETLHTTVWVPGQELDADIVRFMEEGGTIVAHNAGFERAIIRHIATPFYDWPETEPWQWIDTAVLAAASSLPRKLEHLADALGCEQRKDKTGAATMKKLAKAERRGRRWVCPLATPENLARLIAYCEQDVRTHAECFWRLRAAGFDEHDLAIADTEINERGVCVDLHYAASIRRLADERKTDLADEAFETSITELANSTSTPALKSWLKDNGVALPLVQRKRKDGTTYKSESCDAGVVTKLLERDDIPVHVRTVLENRQEANKQMSLAKLKRVQTMEVGGRIYGAFVAYGAHTGRWSSKGIQLHNMPKARLSPQAAKIADSAIQNGDGRLLDFAGAPLHVLSQSLRGIIVASEGCDLIGADYSAIEARVIAWLAGQDDIVRLFANGEDVYTYVARNLGSDIRDVGKVSQLALGFGMGALLYVQTAAKWGVKIDPKVGFRSHRDWRILNSRIVDFWSDLEECARWAIRKPGAIARSARDRLAFTSNGKCLRIFLPSGRALRYWMPRIQHVTKKFRVLREDGSTELVEIGSDEIQFRNYSSAPYFHEGTYGGKLAENVTQAIARDLLGGALVRCKHHGGYPVVVHVHDAAAAEVPEGTGSVEEFCGILEESPAWADGCPVAAEGYRAKRFRG